MKDKYLKYLCKTNFFLTKASSGPVKIKNVSVDASGTGARSSTSRNHNFICERQNQQCVHRRAEQPLVWGWGRQSSPPHIWAAEKSLDKVEVTRKLLKKGNRINIDYVGVC